jgi:predicted RNA-binding protein YlxR (DUF448 family)
MVRFVRSPLDGEVIADIRHKLPGRGVWVTGNAETVAEAVRKKAFARGFRQPCKVSDDLAIEVAERLDEHALGYLSLARKAGQAVQGFEKVDGLIAAGRIAVLIGAADGSEDGRNKLKQRLRSNELDVPVIEFFASGQLGLALGRTNVIHAAISTGGLAGKFVTAANRAGQFRGLAAAAAMEYEENA